MPISIPDLSADQKAKLIRVREIVQEELQAKIASSRKARTKRFRILDLIHYTPPCPSRPKRGSKENALLLIIVSHRALADMSAFWEEVEDRLCQDQAIRQKMLCFTHTPPEIIQQLDGIKPLLATIIEDGSRVCGTPEEAGLQTTSSLRSRASIPTHVMTLSDAERHYAKWNKLARLYLSAGAERSAANDSIARNFAAFQLHQAAESAYRMYFLTVAAYLPATHQLRRMRHLARAVDGRLEGAWHSEASEGEHYFDLLCRAYIEARYSLTYRTSEAALRWQAERIAKLIEIADALCLERLSELGTDGPAPDICQPSQTLV